MNPLLQDLNPAQREAVSLAGGPCLVLAGAGSGKTRVLTHRAAWLVQEAGVRPWEIVAVTFTNKAAGEMRDRVRLLLGSAAAPDVFLGTFHAFCVRLLRREAEQAALAPNFVIYDTPEQVAIVKRTMKEMDISEGDYAPKQILARISSAKNRLLAPEEYRPAGHGPLSELLPLVYERYQRILKEANALDFDDLIMKTVRLLEGNAAVLDRYQERTLHLLVDEYQDTNHAQYRLIKALSGKHRNLMVVGDEDQSIFSWRGADISNILEFERDFPDARIVRLEQNYRSTSRILGAALAVVCHNVRRKGKELWTENLEGDPVHLFRAADGADEAEWTVSRIEEHRASGGSLAQVALMYRTHAQSRLFEEELLRREIPYIVLGGVRFYQRREVKDLLAYLALSVNPHDPAAFLRVVNVPARGIGRKTLDVLEEMARCDGLSLYGALERAASGAAGLPSRAVIALKGFHDLIEALRRQAETKPPDLVLEAALKATGYLDCYAKEPVQERQARAENVEQLLTAAEEAVVRGETAEDFLAGVALQSDVDALHEEEKVPLMTLHSAKGLEFDLVFLAGLEEGLLPHANSIPDPEALEEERRLCYVGMTRARRTLHLSCAYTRVLRGQTRSCVPSRFLEEIPQDRLETKESTRLAAASAWSAEGRARLRKPGTPAAPAERLPAGATQEEALAALERYFGEKGKRAARRVRDKASDRGEKGMAGPRSSPPGAGGDAGRPFRRGDKVRHEEYGAGVVLDVQKVRNDLKITVRFSTGAPRKFMASHAPLRHLLRG